MIVNSHGENPKDVARRFGKLACLKLLGGDTGMETYGESPFLNRFIYFTKMTI